MQIDGIQLDATGVARIAQCFQEAIGALLYEHLDEPDVIEAMSCLSDVVPHLMVLISNPDSLGDSDAMLKKLLARSESILGWVITAAIDAVSIMKMCMSDKPEVINNILIQMLSWSDSDHRVTQSVIADADQYYHRYLFSLRALDPHASPEFAYNPLDLDYSAQEHYRALRYLVSELVQAQRQTRAQLLCLRKTPVTVDAELALAFNRNRLLRLRQWMAPLIERVFTLMPELVERQFTRPPLFFIAEAIEYEKQLLAHTALQLNAIGGVDLTALVPNTHDAFQQRIRWQLAVDQLLQLVRLCHAQVKQPEYLASVDSHVIRILDVQASLMSMHLADLTAQWRELPDAIEYTLVLLEQDRAFRTIAYERRVDDECLRDSGLICEHFMRTVQPMSVGLAMPERGCVPTLIFSSPSNSDDARGVKRGGAALEDGTVRKRRRLLVTTSGCAGEAAAILSGLGTPVAMAMGMSDTPSSAESRSSLSR